MPRPALWRLSLIQCLAWLAAVAVFSLFWPQYAPSILWAGMLVVLAQGFWIWRSLRGFGDPHSSGYLAGATAGLIGKWVIISVGLVLLWGSQLDLSVAATVVTVFGLNTLVAIAAPILISPPR